MSLLSINITVSSVRVTSISVSITIVSIVVRSIKGSTIVLNVSRASNGGSYSSGSSNSSRDMNWAGDGSSEM